jgi:hypothetical protein
LVCQFEAAFGVPPADDRVAKRLRFSTKQALRGKPGALMPWSTPNSPASKHDDLVRLPTRDEIADMLTHANYAEPYAPFG